MHFDLKISIRDNLMHCNQIDLFCNFNFDYNFIVLCNFVISSSFAVSCNFIVSCNFTISCNLVVYNLIVFDWFCNFVDMCIFAVSNIKVWKKSLDIAIAQKDSIDVVVVVAQKNSIDYM